VEWQEVNSMLDTSGSRTIAPPGQEGWRDEQSEEQRGGGSIDAGISNMDVEPPPRHFVPPLLARRGNRSIAWSLKYVAALTEESPSAQPNSIWGTPPHQGS